MATSTLKQQQLPWTTAKLVPEALQQRLHVVEDPALIALLGRSKFVDMVVFGAPGWQHGVSIYHPYCLGCFSFPNESCSTPGVLDKWFVAALLQFFGP
jgi:hypothetical protein